MQLITRITGITSFIFAIGALLIASSLPAVAKSSSYQRTCRDITINGNVLSALCKRGNGSELRSSITLKAIENIDGALMVRDPKKSASFHLTCIDSSVDQAVLASVCKKRNGQYQSTNTSINGIENIDGVLNYTSGP